MKIVFAGLISLLLFSCAHTKTDLSQMNITLPAVSADERFVSYGEDRYKLKAEDSDIRVLRYKFKTGPEALTYLMNRRMLLHRSFQDDVAPYFGLIKSEQECLAMVDIKADIKSDLPGAEYFFMQLPINRNNVVLDCHQKEIWGLASYYFFHCTDSHDVFEVRYNRPRDVRPRPLNVTCR